MPAYYTDANYFQLPECTWKDLKDWVRVICNPGWVDVPGNKSSHGKERYGWIKFRKQVDADACFEWLSKNGFEKKYPLFLKYKLIVEGVGIKNLGEYPSPSQTDRYRQISAQADTWFDAHHHTFAASSPSVQFIPWEPRTAPASPHSSHQPYLSFTPSPYGCVTNNQSMVLPMNCQPVYAIGLEGQPVNTTRGSVQVHKKSIFIKGLEKSISEESLKRKLSHDVGDVETCQIQLDRDGQSRGIAIVTFRSSPKAQEAIDRFNKHRLSQKHTNKLEVRWAKEDAASTPKTQGLNSRKCRDLGAPVIANGSS